MSGNLTQSEIKSMRRSMLKGVLQAVHDCLLPSPDHAAQDIWHDGDSREWAGPEVMRECESLYREIARVIKTEIKP